MAPLTREWVNRAHELGYTALALTDESSLADIVHTHLAARKVGLPLILGSESRIDHTLHPACDSDDPFADMVGNVAGFSLHAGVATKVHGRDKLERLYRYIARPAVYEKRLSLTVQGKVRYELKTPFLE